MSDRLLKLHKGKWTRHVGGIRQRHQSCLKLSAEHCCCVVENVLYTVVGSQDITYSVRQNDAVPHEAQTCAVKCHECNICVHSFSCTCLDSALRNTICKHIHLVFRIYKPICHYATIQTSNDPDTSNHECENPEQQHDDDREHIPDVSEVSPNFPPVLSDVCESDAIMSDVSSRRPSRDINQLMGNAELDWADIKTDVGDNRVAAQVVSEHMSRLRSLVIALGHEPETSRLPPAPPSNEPVNKLASMQGSIKSTTKQKPLRHEMTASKPSMGEKEFLLRTLGGNERVISQLLSMDHDSACNLAAQDINFEHSYTKP